MVGGLAGVVAAALGLAAAGADVGTGSVIAADLTVFSLGKPLSRYDFPCF